MTRIAPPFMDLLEAEAIAGGILLPRRRDAPAIDPADVQRHRSVLPPDSVSLAGAEDEEKDELRIKANRSDYRRVGLRTGRRRS